MSVVVIIGAGQGQGAAEELAGADCRQLDVTDQAGWTDLARDLAERHGRVHGLVANAGLTWRARLLDVTPAEIPVDGGMTAHGGVKSISDAVRA